MRCIFLMVLALVVAVPVVWAADDVRRITRVHVSDRDGHFSSLQEAVDAAPDGGDGLYEILLHPGTHREKVHVPKSKGPIRIAGRSAAETLLVWNDAASTPGPDGKELGTFRSSTLTVESDDFSMANVTLENDFGKGSQAVALRVSGDRAVFRNCRFLAWQDTVLVEKKRQYFKDCEIAGHVDFIFGASMAYFDGCLIRCRGDGFITAASTPEDQAYGYVFSKCRVVAEEGVKRVFLGRPWRPHASVYFLKCELPAVIVPGGWDPWGKEENKKTARYYEWRSSGPGAGDRVEWARVPGDPEARGLVPAVVLNKWDPDACVSLERVAVLPEAERAAWMAYLEKSSAAARLDRETLADERKEHGVSGPLPAPKGKDFSWKGNERDAAWFRSREARELTGVILSFQTPAGGWSKAVSYDKGPRAPGMHWTSQGGEGWHYTGTVDNASTLSQLRFLAASYEARKDQPAKAGFLRGLHYLLNAQYPNGGWPQVWPLQGGYHDHVTFNDGAMIRVMEFLDEVASGTWSFVPTDLRKNAGLAVENGTRCLLAAQYVRDGKRTVWGAQHDAIRLQPARARMQEPMSLSGGESVEIVRFLMRKGGGFPETKEAVRAAVEWFEQAKLTGIRRGEKEGRNHYETGTRDKDPWWPRFADLETDRPLFSGSKDGHLYHDFEELWQSNPTEYAYYVNQAARLLEREYPAWKPGR